MTGSKSKENVLAFRRDAVAVERPASTRLLNIPKAFCRILDRDLKAAGIPVRNDVRQYA